RLEVGPGRMGRDRHDLTVDPERPRCLAHVGWALLLRCHPGHFRGTCASLEPASYRGAGGQDETQRERTHGFGASRSCQAPTNFRIVLSTFSFAPGPDGASPRA